MGENILNILILIVEIFLMVLVFIGSFRLLRHDLKNRSKELYKKKKKEYRKKIKESPDKLYAYDAMNDKMRSLGIKFRMGESFSPFDYIVMRLGVGTGLCLLLMLINPFLSIVGFLVGYVIVPLYFKLADKLDNEDMLADIRTMYSLICVHINNGVYVSDSVYKCFLRIKHPRLKKALLELSLDIGSFDTVKEATGRFRGKFNNKYIEFFANTLEQMQDTGKSVALFENMTKNINKLGQALTKKEEDKAELRGVFFTSLSVVAIIVYIAYMFVLLLGENGGGITGAGFF